MNYPFTRFCLGFFGKSTLDPETFAGTGYGQIKLYKSGMQFLGDLDAELDKYDWNITQVQLSLLGSHDTPRFLTCASGDVSAYRLSVLFGITLPGAFCLYYGDEVGMSGGRDPDCRRGMIWDRAQWDADLLAFIKRMTALRHQNRVLRRGRFKALVGEGARMVIAFERRVHDSEAAVAIVVFNADKVDDEMHLHGIEAGTYTELVGGMGGKSTGSRELVVKADGKALIRVPRRSGMIFVKSLASGSHHL
jgi:neopullulanase